MWFHQLQTTSVTLSLHLYFLMSCILSSSSFKKVQSLHWAHFSVYVTFHCHTFDVSIDAKHNIHTFCPCTWWFVNIVCCGAESVSRSLLICALRLCLYLRPDILCMFICQPQRLYKPVSSWGLSTKLATTNDVKLWTISPFQASKVQKPAWPVFLFCFVWL